MKNKNKRYKKNREKLLNQEIQSLQSQTQDNYETGSSKNQNETLLKDETYDKKQFLSEKKLSNHLDNRHINNYSDRTISSYCLSDTGNINQNRSSFQAEKHKKKMQKQINKFQKGEKEVYDPLSKDMDNDGVIDRYDVDFRDSKVSYRTLTDDEKYDNNQNDKGKNYNDYVKNPKSKNKRYKNYVKDTFSKERMKSENQKKYVRSNFDDEEFTRNKDTKNNLFQDVNNKRKTTDKNSSRKRKGKFENKEKKISKLQQKKQRQEQKLKNKGIDGKSQSAKSAVIATGMAKRYLESGKEDNAGVGTAYKVTDQVENISRKIYYHGKKKNLKRQKKITKLGKSIDKQEKKLFFQKNMEEMKKSVDYQNTSRLRQFFKRRQYKNQIQKKYKDSVKNRIKKSFIEGSKRFGEFVKGRGKKIIFLSLLAVGIFFMLFQAGSMMMNMGTGMVSNTVSTTYLSSEDTLKEINQRFSSLEQALQEEMDSVEENHPGYDEYIIKGKEKIGHNVHELLSYITARYGIVKNISEVESELKHLFQKMYTLTYKEEIEIRYRTVTSSYTDADGNEHTESHEEPYEYRKLIVTLEKREMDGIIREAFKRYPNNLAHYETLFLTQGNMGEVFGNIDLINSNGGIGGGKEYEASSEVQKKIVNAAYITPSPGAGWCAMWVSQVYQNAGLGFIGGNACDMYRNYTFTSDRSKLKVGMLVAVESSSSGSSLGVTYGHVGIYIGDGKVMGNIGHIRVTTLDDWIATFCKHHPVGFGFPPSVQK
ncbi:conjugative transposon membrane protein [Streptococcus equi subsp. equi]|uniref:CHAP domain-containing protein n=1 Tax=Streptococcus equi TaxID=1336 RepID=UPI000657A92D|nr:CHAP domain-containing protein [Streptococcus equi]CRR00949.1 conjugative transposon membrane protein [Streptococcus equi subsp. equi]CRR08828.1 conjugative transposon membrane protein [Streptococcus equi subsp. equi]CRR10609.1 conjugative transposon membrane protein [Streptococcus equi subsp. equi]CRT10191.1 conjugative transposon membrane protein [Streptococcus equi subsp. equi]CRT10346.1 conjugative transposon membrane protein [Streptococcus equi subsp. equi]